jgi:hypothetical protein
MNVAMALEIHQCQYYYVEFFGGIPEISAKAPRLYAIRLNFTEKTYTSRLCELTGIGKGLRAREDWRLLSHRGLLFGDRFLDRLSPCSQVAA